MSRHLRVLSTGGTIASTGEGDGATPKVTGQELIEAVPSIEHYAEITVDQVVQRPSFEMDFEAIIAVAKRAKAAILGGADGVVVTHGTDTMEESAYLFDRVVDVEKPIVFTGAQRRPDEVSPDGPANLVTAIKTAANNQFGAAGGVYIAFDETIHAAETVSKVHTSKLGTFQSPDSGPVASETREGFRFHREPGGQQTMFKPIVPDADIRIIPSAVGISRAPIDEAVDAGVDGIVLDGTGLGNATGDLGNAAGDAIDAGVPVVVSSRCLGGETRAVYGGNGGGETLRQHGVGFAGALSAQKARIELALALSQLDAPLTHFESS